MLGFLGLQQLPADTLFWMAAMSVAVCVLVGWATDAIMSDAGFGLIGNAGLATVSALVGARIWFIQVGHGVFRETNLLPMMFAGFAAGVLVLMFAAVLKKMFASA